MLIEYAQESDLEGVTDILTKGASIPSLHDTRSDDQYTVLHHACFRGSLPIAKLLVDQGASLHLVDKFNKTALHIAVQKGFSEIVSFLLSRVHPMDVPRGAKFTLVQMAAANGHADIVRLLALKGVNVDERNELGETPLHLATKGNKLEAMSMLIGLGADVMAKTDKVGMMPMHYSCMYGFSEATMMLLKAGADAHAPNSTRLGRTPLETAKDSGFRPLFNALLMAETVLREEREDQLEEQEMLEEAKHERVLERLDGMERSNREMKKTLVMRRTEQKALEEDHELRLKKAKENAQYRRASKIRANMKKH